MDRQRVRLKQYVSIVYDIKVRLRVILRNVPLYRRIGDKLFRIFQPTVCVDSDLSHRNDTDEQSDTIVTPT